METNPVLLKPNWAITPELKERLVIFDNAWHKYEFWHRPLTAKWRNELYAIARAFSAQCGTEQFEKAVDKEYQNLRREKVSNRYAYAVRLILVWVRDFKPELNAQMLFSTLQCRPSYIDLVSYAYYINY